MGIAGGAGDDIIEVGDNDINVIQGNGGADEITLGDGTDIVIFGAESKSADDNLVYDTVNDASAGDMIKWSGDTDLDPCQL